MKYLLLPLCLCLSVSLFSQGGGRTRTSLDTAWKFHFGHASNPEKDFNYGLANIFSKSGNSRNTAMDARFPDSSWRKVDLPHDWAVELPFAASTDFDHASHGFKPVGGAYPETSIGWYRKKFDVNPADSGKRFEVRFDGIFRDAKIWLNGFYLGNNLSGYVGVNYDVTDYINFKGSNTLVVRADATQYEGWFYEGAGIYRHVWLDTYSNQHFADGGLFVKPTVKGKDAVIALEAVLENRGLTSSDNNVSFYITDRGGNVIGRSSSQRTILKANETKMVNLSVPLRNARLWSLEDPYLYRVVAQVKSGNDVVDEVNLTNVSFIYNNSK